MATVWFVVAVMSRLPTMMVLEGETLAEVVPPEEALARNAPIEPTAATPPSTCAFRLSVLVAITLKFPYIPLLFVPVLINAVCATTD